MKTALAVAALVVGASAFSPLIPKKLATQLFNGPAKGAGGMFDTRDPDSFEHEDPRKSISDAPSFEEYLKQRAGGDASAAAPAPAPAAPAPAAYSPPSYAPAPAPAPASSEPMKGAGGMFDTRDPEALEHEDPRKSISDAPSFEEYMRQRQQ